MGLPPPLPQAEDIDHQPLLGPYNKSRQDRSVFGDRDSAPTCPSSPGPRTSGTRWSRAGHPPMTLPRPATGPNSAAKASHRSTAAPSTCSAGETAAAAMRRPASARDRDTSPQQWDSGTAPPARRSPGTSSHAAGRPTGGARHARTLPPPGDRRTRNQHLSIPEPPTGPARGVCVDEAHARFLGRRGMRPAYPATSSARISMHEMEYPLTPARPFRRSPWSLFYRSGRKSDRQGACRYG